jgi:biopolymer transport protein TolR
VWDSSSINNYRRPSPTPNASINVTSLVDVAFTLLIIFIITAPILQGGVEVELPRAESAPITSSEGVIVTVARNGGIYIGDVEVRSSEEFATIFPEYVRDRDIRQAYLKGDREVPYGRLLQVLGLMQRLDVVEVGLISDPEMERPL